MRPAEASSAEPDNWNVVFHRDTRHRWLGWLAWGHFKHVSLFGFVRAAQAWVFLEVTIGRTAISVVPDHLADPVIERWTAGADVIAVRAGSSAHLKPGLWCVPVVAHILGLPGCALRPDTLYRQCLAHGGKLIEERPADEAEANGDQSGGAERSGA